jgi:hypothetical protein
MLHRPAAARGDDPLAPNDRSMAVLQYLVATVALVSAIVLTLTR